MSGLLPEFRKRGVDALLQFFITLRSNAAAVDEEAGSAFQPEFDPVIKIRLDHLGELS